ncbi:actin-like ATPase domain-containing protein [Microthyrium microscopicum]|uniref:Phosphotransferase n=1 Tax=Microthyrium microscopicum TaxID=703497 RepID=A0A6A6UNC7_9PEZI|nr:actin-like ATPase domain-containing protein [Microthyrium microscopicum]
MSPFSSPKSKHISTLDSSQTSSPRYSTEDKLENGISTKTGLQSFLQNVTEAFESQLETKQLLELSEGLQAQFREKLASSNMCMLPSYNHTLPTGMESGSYLALDVGGTNFRVALVNLSGSSMAEEGSKMRIVKMTTFKIDSRVRALKGHDFFDWMAEGIETVVNQPEVREAHGDGIYAMGVAWSFPLEETSIRTGRLLAMGKGFSATHGVAGTDLTELIMRACSRKSLPVRMDAIINDGSATLLSCAYTNPTTRFGLILGTGTNMSIILPVSALSPSKFASRPAVWMQQAKHVLVNSEFSMFGNDLLPATRWDAALNVAHPMPDFQPFEYRISGRYIGELVRLVLLDAVKEAGLFGGDVPRGLEEAYVLDAGVLAAIDVDADSTALSDAFPCIMTSEERQLVQRVVQLITRRAASLLAAGIHAMCQLRNSSEDKVPAKDADVKERVAIGCNGSVIERYPDFRARTQRTLDALMHGSQTVELEIAVESAIYGAAVAVGCLEGIEG